MRAIGSSSYDECRAHAVDWRARAIAAESELETWKRGQQGKPACFNCGAPCKHADDVAKACSDGVMARIRGDKPEAPFPKRSAHEKAWLIGYGGQECADERDAERKRADEAEASAAALSKRLESCKCGQ